MLERAGHQVHVVGDGAEAITAVQTSSCDPVLMDVQMPGMHGVTATGRIRAWEGQGRQLPIVALTADVLPDPLAALREAGMDDHVTKPFRSPDLLAAARRMGPPDGRSLA